MGKWLGKRLKGGVTLEAALIMPFMIWFFVNIMSVFDILCVQSAVLSSLHQAGNELCLRAFDIRFAPDLAQGAYGTVHAGNRVRESLRENRIRTRCVEGGADGITFLRSVLNTGGDTVELVADYRVRPLLKVLPFPSFPMEERYYGHAWTGYDITKGASENAKETEYVYVTPNGTVYHRRMDCSHLKLSVTSTSVAELESRRNRGGAVYHPCERCRGGGGQGTVFITNYGNRYHMNAQCPGLKRTVYTVPLSETGGKGACSKCGR